MQITGKNYFKILQMKRNRELIFFCFMLLLSVHAFSQKPAYGNNPEAGKYINVGDAKIYYEVYGKGEPVVMLHGGVYGYIDEFEPFINRLSEKFQVICIATRGHGKSEIGTKPFTYRQRAEDAYKVIRSITKVLSNEHNFFQGILTGFKESVGSVLAFGGEGNSSQTELKSQGLTSKKMKTILLKECERNESSARRHQALFFQLLPFIASPIRYFPTSFFGNISSRIDAL